MRTNVSRPVALLSSGLLLLGSVGAALAAPPQSFEATFCLFYNGGLQTTVTWSGYRVDAVFGGQIDEQHREVVVSIDPAARQGTVTVGLPYDDAVPHVTAGIRLGKHVWESITVQSTGLDFPNLPRC